MTDKSETAKLKIIDFGLSDFFGPNETSTCQFGTLGYAAPEVLLEQPHGKEVDHWSLGVLIYLFLQKQLPFDSKDDNDLIWKTIYKAPNYS